MQLEAAAPLALQHKRLLSPGRCGNASEQLGTRGNDERELMEVSVIAGQLKALYPQQCLAAAAARVPATILMVQDVHRDACAS